MCLTKVLFQVSTHAHFHLIPAIQNQKINMTDNCDIRKRVMQAADITEFQRRVYLELLCIPSGTTITYAELAHRIGCRSAQAVGQALRRNPFAPEVPCHRVVASDGTAGGYFGKTSGEMIVRKIRLLEEERLQNPKSPDV